MTHGFDDIDVEIGSKSHLVSGDREEYRNFISGNTSEG